jgi:RNA-splicing ligase RtcB
MLTMSDTRQELKDLEKRLNKAIDKLIGSGSGDYNQVPTIVKLWERRKRLQKRRRLEEATTGERYEQKRTEAERGTAEG